MANQLAEFDGDVTMEKIMTEDAIESQAKDEFALKKEEY